MWRISTNFEWNTYYIDIQEGECIAHFRPIAICNIVIKGITKFITNRLKSIMTKIVDEQQCSFIPGRQGIDNIVIV